MGHKTKFVLIAVCGILAAGVIAIILRENSNNQDARMGKDNGGDRGIEESMDSLDEHEDRQKPAKTEAEKTGMVPSQEITINKKERETQKKESLDAEDIERIKKEALAQMERKAYDKAATGMREVFEWETAPEAKFEAGKPLVICLVKMERYAEAQRVLKSLMSMDLPPEKITAIRQQQAALLAKMGRGREAEQILEESMGKSSDSKTKTAIEEQLARTRRQTPGRMNEVVSNLNQRVESNPNDEESLRKLGRIYLRSRRDYEKAKPVYEKLANLNPGDNRIQQTLRGIYYETGEYKKLQSIYEDEIMKHPENESGLRYKISMLKMRSGKGDDAVEYAEEHLGGDDASSMELQRLSEVYDSANREEQSYKTLEKAIAAEEDSHRKTKMRFNYAEKLYRNKKYKDAETILRGILEGHSGNKTVRKRVNNQLVNIYRAQGKLGELDL